VELSSCHLCGTLNLEVAPRFWEIFVPLLVGVYQCFRGTCYLLWQGTWRCLLWW